jgi:hypothetical protein
MLMRIKLEKLAVASVVAGALGFAGSASAITMGEAKEVMLVPLVTCDTANQVNTLVGMTTQYANRASNPARLATKATGVSARQIHWRWYNNLSEHKLDGTMSVTDNDFVRFDWCSVLTASGKLNDHNGESGYLLIHDEALFTVAAPGPVSRTLLHGHGYRINGNWASQAFLPIMTVATLDAGIGPTGYPRINNLRDGVNYDRADQATAVADSQTDAAVTAAANFRQVALRFFLDPALSTGTDFVFWFNRNARGTAADANQNRTAVPAETFDSEQVYQNSSNVDLSRELNVLSSTPTSVALAGMNTGFDGDATNTGLAHFYVPVGNPLSTTAVTYGGGFATNDAAAGADGRGPWNFRNTGLTFGMVHLGAGANANQVQTELALEGLRLNGPF